MRTRQTIVIMLLVATGLALAGLAISVRTPRLTSSSSSPASATASPSSTPGTPADRAIRAAEAEITRDPQRSEGYVTLATAYMRKVRESGDTGYYRRAEAAVQRALALQPGSPEGLRTLAWVQTGKHEFREALATAEHLRAQRSDDP